MWNICIKLSLSKKDYICISILTCYFYALWKNHIPSSLQWIVYVTRKKTTISHSNMNFYILVIINEKMLMAAFFFSSTPAA